MRRAEQGGTRGSSPPASSVIPFVVTLLLLLAFLRLFLVAVVRVAQLDREAAGPDVELELEVEVGPRRGIAEPALRVGRSVLVLDVGDDVVAGVVLLRRRPHVGLLQLEILEAASAEDQV